MRESEVACAGHGEDPTRVEADDDRSRAGGDGRQVSGFPAKCCHTRGRGARDAGSASAAAPSARGGAPFLARSRGLGQTRLFLRHLLKPSSLPVVTVVALAVGELLGGALITETIFGRTGIGSLVQRSVTTQDLPVLQAVVALAAVVFVVVNLLADLVYPLLDPRVRLGDEPPGRDKADNAEVVTP
ncbi:MAG: peptide/nickel transport system permease protein [Actinomycetota bacterium]|nr:peptide/nickel transport system permease protein [Actinomycetota bacterium]